MAGNRKVAQPQHRDGPDGSDGLVLVSMALVAAAVVVGLHMQMGLSLALAGLVGLSLFLGLAGFQAWRRGLAERVALSGEVERLEAEVGRLRSPAARVRADRIAAGLRLEAPAPVAARAEEAPALPPVARESDAKADYWSFRPSEALLSTRPEPEPHVAIEPEACAPTPPTASSAVCEDDVEMLQRRIKEMLYQVTAAEQAREGTSPATDGEAAPEAQERPVAALGIEASLGALRAAAQSMRTSTTRPLRGEQGSPIVTKAPAAAVPVAGDPPSDPQLAALKEAIGAGRVDVFLEPILGLGNQAAQHYEVSIKVRGAACEDLGTGEGDVLPGRGLLPLFDAARIQRSAIVAERLAGRGKPGSVFSHANGESLIEPSFTRDLQQEFGGRPVTAGQLVLTFAQSDIRSFRAAEQRAVALLSSLGFRFAISGLTDLDMNFEAMATAGFGFVKLDVGVLTAGLPHPGGHIPAPDVCRYLAEYGFGLIVEGIDSEETLARVFGFGVLLGQGALFGGRRPVKADVVARPGQAAA